MIVRRHDQILRGGIYDWLLAHRREVFAGTAVYLGSPVIETTQFRQYKCVVSLGHITHVYLTSHRLPTAANGYLRWDRWKYTLISIVFGWWGIPFGPFETLDAIAWNFGGDSKRTAASLLQLVQWGWDAPNDALMGAHKRRMIEISERAAAEIRSRMEAGGFSEELAVRVTPTKWADTEVKITFDYPVSDGRDWVDESQSRGISVLIDKQDESKLSGSRIEFHDGKFFAKIVRRAPLESDC